MGTRRLRSIATALAVSAMCVACGLGEPDGPTVMGTPEIVWQDGITPSSPLEDDPIIKKARAAEIGLAMAYNTGDFTIAQVTDNLTTDFIDFTANRYADQYNNPEIYPGPWPWEPRRIISTSENKAVFEVCVLTNLDDTPWLKYEKYPGGNMIALRQSFTNSISSAKTGNGKCPVDLLVS